MPPKFRNRSRTTAIIDTTSVLSNPSQLINAPSVDVGYLDPIITIPIDATGSTGGGTNQSPLRRSSRRTRESSADHMQNAVAGPSRVSVPTLTSSRRLFRTSSSDLEKPALAIGIKTESASHDHPTTPTRSSKRIKIEPNESPQVKPDTHTPNTPSTPLRRIKAELAEPNSPINNEASVNGTSQTPRTPRKAMPMAALAKAHPEPARWREQYKLIERMRAGIVAPVDDMGCERPNHPNISPRTRRFHILISLMLSSQTKDAVTSAAVTSLHSTLPGGLTPESLIAAPEEVVSGCINKVGFWRRKTDYIRDAARYILGREPGVGDDGGVEEKGDVPKSLEGLCGIKGVGPKMAYLALQCAWEINAGIGVDVHVHRITNRLKWHKPPTQTPEQTRINLESWLPKELFRGVNPMMVGFGQMICLPVGPRCDVCLLSSAKICPSRVANVRSEGRKEVVFTYTRDDVAGDEVEVEDGKVEVKVEMELGRESELDAGVVHGLHGVYGHGLGEVEVKVEETEGVERMPRIGTRGGGAKLEIGYEDEV